MNIFKILLGLCPAFNLGDIVYISFAYEPTKFSVIEISPSGKILVLKCEESDFTRTFTLHELCVRYIEHVSPRCKEGSGREHE